MPLDDRAEPNEVEGIVSGWNASRGFDIVAGNTYVDFLRNPGK
jgi:hypothetical protein